MCNREDGEQSKKKETEMQTNDKRLTWFRAVLSSVASGAHLHLALLPRILRQVAAESKGAARFAAAKVRQLIVHKPLGELLGLFILLLLNDFLLFCFFVLLFLIIFSVFNEILYNSLVFDLLYSISQLLLSLLFFQSSLSLLLEGFLSDFSFLID